MTQGSDAWQIVPELAPQADEIVIDKITMSALESTFLNIAMRDATIGIIWLNHHSMFHSVRKVEHTTLTLNLLLLLIVSFIPYPTAVLSKYGALPSSAFLYGAVLSLLGISYSLLWMHILRRQLSSVCADKSETDKKIRRNLLGTLVYPTATIVSLRFPRVSVVVYFALAAFYFFPGKRQSNIQES